VALCFAIFKLFRIPVNQWTLATAALGGVFGLALLFITMAYNHPFSTNARIYFFWPLADGSRCLLPGCFRGQNGHAPAIAARTQFYEYVLQINTKRPRRMPGPHFAF